MTMSLTKPPPIPSYEAFSAILLTAAETVTRSWIQGDEARTPDGKPVMPSSPDASGWCAAGAVCAAMPDHMPVTAHILINERLRLLIGDDAEITEYNDACGRTASEVATTLRELARIPEPDKPAPDSVSPCAVCAHCDAHVCLPAANVCPACGETVCPSCHLHSCPPAWW